MYVKAKPQSREMSRQLRFSDKVSQAVFNTNTGTELCTDKLERCELAEEDEVNARSFEFHLRQEKKSLYLCPRRKSFNKTVRGRKREKSERRQMSE